MQGLPSRASTAQHRISARRLPRRVPANIQVEVITTSSGTGREFSSGESDVQTSISAPRSPTHSSDIEQRPQPDGQFHVVVDSSPTASQSVTQECGDSTDNGARESIEEDGDAAQNPLQDDAMEKLASDMESLDLVPSVGSRLHYEGTCRPCVFLYRTCIEGAACRYCHLHPGFKRDHPSKERRMRLKRRLLREAEAAAAAAAAGTESGADNCAVPAAGAGNSSGPAATSSWQDPRRGPPDAGPGRGRGQGRGGAASAGSGKGKGKRGKAAGRRLWTGGQWRGGWT